MQVQYFLTTGSVAPSPLLSRTHLAIHLSPPASACAGPAQRQIRRLQARNVKATQDQVARRFGWRGLAVFVGAAAVFGPPGDYLFAAKCPEWMVFAPGVAPILADAVTYIGILALGHAVVCLVAGPAREDQLARRHADTA